MIKFHGFGYEQVVEVFRVSLLYNILLLVGVSLGLPFICMNLLLSKKRRKTFLHRLGLFPMPGSIHQPSGETPPTRPIWIHALSVGEVLSAVPLVQATRERFNHAQLVFSVSTQTGYEIAIDRLKPLVDGVFFFPYDLGFSVRRIVGRVQPGLVLIVETDLWPNFLFEMKRQKVPVVLANARLSQRSFSGYQYIRFLMKPVFRTFNMVCVQSLDDAERFQRLGIDPGKITITGNIKFDQLSVSSGADDGTDALRHRFRVQPEQKVLLAGSTHEGEESILFDAFLRIKKKNFDLLFIVVPRNPDRAPSVCQALSSQGLTTVLMTSIGMLTSDNKIDAIVVDTIGMLRSLYSLADIAYVGGSLVKCGGHNPIEPAAFAKPILFGPDMSDFKEISDMLLKSRGAIQVDDANSLFNAAVTLLEDKEAADAMGARAYHLFRANKGAVEKTLKAVETCIQSR